jgi:hypothetical protein
MGELQVGEHLHLREAEQLGAAVLQEGECGGNPQDGQKARCPIGKKRLVDCH